MTRALLILPLLIASSPKVAEACGCFTPPNPTVPVVQAGERILFAVKGGQVTAHIQVQYTGTGDGSDFGWLLPLPSVPTLELGVNELFAQLTQATQPLYVVNTRFENDCQRFFGAGGAGGSSGFADAGSSSGGGSESPLVVKDSVGPYDYAVLRADSKDDMLKWLEDNRYFVPTGTDQGVAPYIRPGAYFLALKLKAGNTAGDIQPVVLRYASDVGMIPLTLTATGAVENMGVQVWMLGQGRAIPRNYHHTVLNDSVIDWRTGGQNYREVIIRAAGEAPGKHTFVTEFAGSSAVLSGALASPERYGTVGQLAIQATPREFIRTLHALGFATPQNFGPLPGTVVAVLRRYLPVKPGESEAFCYSPFSTCSFDHVAFQPAAMADEIFKRFVTPMRQAQELFDELPKLTRLFTTVSPADMNRDPVFAFNASLPDVSNRHDAEMRVFCDSNGRENFAVLTTEQRWGIAFPEGRQGAPSVDVRTLPASLRIEILAEEGAPEVITDNTAKMDPVHPSPPPRRTGCTVVDGAWGSLLAVWAALRLTSAIGGSRKKPSRRATGA